MAYRNDAACKLLDDLVLERLLPTENQRWIENAIITRLWFAVNAVEADEMIPTLEELFDKVRRHSKSPLTVAATHAAQTVR